MPMDARRCVFLFPGSTGLRARFREAGGGPGSHGQKQKARRTAARASGMPRVPLIERSGSAMNEKKNQCIHCSVESCRHLKPEQGICSLESIQVAPTPMAYSGDPADESMCQSYHCK